MTRFVIFTLCTIIVIRMVSNKTR